MSSLLEALSQGTYDLQNKRDLSTDFSRKLLAYRDKIVGEYVKDRTTNLSQAIAGIVKSDGLNKDQAQRIVEEVNNQVYLILYSEMKDFPEREVNFDLADTAKVMELSGEKPKTSKTSKTASSGGGSLEKTASTKDNFDLLSCGRHGLDLSERISTDNEISYYKHAAAKILDSIKKLATEEEHLANEVLDDTVTIGEAFVEYSKQGVDVQRVFDRLSKEASLGTDYQSLIKSGCEEAIRHYQKELKLPEKYEVKLAYTNSAEKEKYSLGDYSLSKVASIVECPMVGVNGRYVNNFGTLIKIAQDVVNGTEHIKKIRKEKKNILDRMAKNNVDMDSLEKMAVCGRLWVQNLQ